MSAGGADGREAGLPEASLVESVGVALTGLLPTLARGLFAPRPVVSRVLAALDIDRRAISALSSLRRERGGEGARLFGGRLVVLWGTQAIREVLDRSAGPYAADAGAKGKGMSHFQPDALTISRGKEWRDRRAFNESVLAASERVHPMAERFLAVVGEEVERLRIGRELGWDEWEGLFDRVTLRVIFGDRAREDQKLTQGLKNLMAEANRLVGLSKGGTYFDFYGRLEGYLIDPEPGSLVARFADAPQTDDTRVAHQIPHWIFAMRGTLGTNTYRTLAAIVADPDVERRVREELADADLSAPSALNRLDYLEGCLQEGMRLWPTTPLLARETTEEVTLAGERINEGAQVVILNTFNHRDGETVPRADELWPERWTGGDPDPYRFNHLSHGTQDCPGGPLVSLLGKAVLTRVIERYALTLLEPDLPAGEPLPLTLDPVDVRLGVAEIESTGGEV